jgi:hypothetical protein
MRIATNRLDSTSLDYLRQIEQTQGSGSNGVFVPRTSTWQDPRRGWFKFVFFGVVALGVAALLTQPSLLAEHFQVIRWWQLGLTTAGVLFLGIAIVRRGRKVEKQALGDFLHVDALHVWEVSPDRVDATCIEDLTDVDGTHHLYGGSYLYSNFVITVPGDRHEMRISSRAKAEQVMKFVNLLRTLRNSDNEGLRLLLRANPEMAAAIAMRLANDQPVEDLSNMATGPTLPRPKEESSSTAAAPAAGRGGRKLLPWLAAAAAAGLAYVFFPILDRHLMDNHLYAKALAAFQQGRIGLLRDYLAEPGNVYHRAEAWEKVGVIYDKVIDKLTKSRDLRGEKATPIDEKMFTAVIDLLKALKQSARPVVLVGFSAKQDPEPTTEEQKQFEKFIYDARVKEKPELEGIARSAPDKSAILSRGRTFDDEQTRLRERLILERLQQSVQKVLGEDILTLERAADGEKPTMDVAYHVHPSGGLYIYTMGNGVTETVKGLIRGYNIDWTITFRTPGTENVYECKFPSMPATNLNYDGRPGDPDWAPYAIVLYSGFDDMSRRLIKNFGLEPPPPPGSYSFAGVTGAAPARKP